MKKISILGATGSIGQNTLNLISSEKDNFKVVGLTGAGNIDLLAQSAINFGADIVATADESKFSDLKDLLSGNKIEVCAGLSGILKFQVSKLIGLCLQLLVQLDYCLA